MKKRRIRTALAGVGWRRWLFSSVGALLLSGLGWGVRMAVVWLAGVEHRLTVLETYVEEKAKPATLDFEKRLRRVERRLPPRTRGPEPEPTVERP